MRWHQSLVAEGGNPETVDQAAELLFGVMAVGDDRNIDETWVAGKRAYKCLPKAESTFPAITVGGAQAAQSAFQTI
jgi:hypothetical protein